MKVLILIMILCMYAGQLFAQEQMAIRLNDKGIMKILRKALEYNSTVKGSRSVVIPKNIYKFTIPKEKLLSNPIIPIVNEISDLNMTQDLNYYLNISDINITGIVNEQSLKISISNSHANGFDIKISIELPKVIAKSPSVSLCEDRLVNLKECGDGLKMGLTNIEISTTEKPVVLTMVLRLKTDGNIARVNVVSVESTFEGLNAPKLEIDFQDFIIPRIAIVVNGKTSELNTSGLKKGLLKKKDFLAQKLLSFCADFMANDIAEMINVYLVNKEVATSFEIYRKGENVKFNEFLSNRDLYPTPWAPYTRPVANIKSDPLSPMLAQITELVRNAQIAIKLKSISTPGNKDVELAGIMGIILNGKQLDVKNTLGNSNRALPKPKLEEHRDNDINLAISEPLINGVLDLANSTNLFQEIFNKSSPMPHVKIKTVKLHFAGPKSMKVIVNIEIDLKKLKADGKREWLKNTIATWLERNNNNSVIYFPIEVPVVPVMKVLDNGEAGLDLYVLSPFRFQTLQNAYNYPSNVQAATDTVRKGIMEELRTSLEPHTNKAYKVDLTKYLNQSGVTFVPRSLSIDQGAYLILDLDIADIKFNSKNPQLR